MKCKDTQGISFNEPAIEDMARCLLLRKRRQYAREYMRKWRSDPGNHQIEHESRRRCYRERKLRAAADPSRATAKTNSPPVCGLCRRRPSIAEVVRLRMREKARDGYVEVRIPYCGQC
jgi:hypothetical protein